MEKQIMEQHLQETAGDLEFAERELSRRGSPVGTPPREDSEDGSPRQYTPSLRKQHAEDPEHLKEENERIMEVAHCVTCLPFAASQHAWPAELLAVPTSNGCSINILFGALLHMYLARFRGHSGVYSL